MPIIQVNARVEIEGRVPSQMDWDSFEYDIYKFIHGTLIPKYGLTRAHDSQQANRFTKHIHTSTDYEACNGCVQAAQDGENLA